MILKMKHDKRFDDYKDNSPLANFVSNDLVAFVEGLVERLDRMNDSEQDSFYGGGIGIIIEWDNGYADYDLSPVDVFIAFYYLDYELGTLGSDKTDVYHPGIMENSSNWYTYEENTEALNIFKEALKELDIIAYKEWLEDHA